MLYTVKPLERIYADPEVFSGKKSNAQNKSNENVNDKASDEYKEVLLPHGRIITRRSGREYVVERVFSTDMKDYLNHEYAPGKSYNK